MNWLRTGKMTSSKFNIEIDLPRKRDRSAIYRINLVKLYRRRKKSVNYLIDNSLEELEKDTKISYQEKLFMEFDFWGVLRKSQLHFKLPPDRINYLRMVVERNKEKFPPDSGTISLMQRDNQLIRGNPFKFKTVWIYLRLINTLGEKFGYPRDVSVIKMGQFNSSLFSVRFRK